MSKLNRSLLWTGLAVAALAACGDDVTVGPDLRVEVTPDGAELQVGATLQFAASVSGGTGTPTIVWSSSNPAVASISATGLVTGVTPGTTSIKATVTAGGATAEDAATLTVTSGAPEQPPSVSIGAITTTVCDVFGGCTEVPVNLLAVAGQINVSVNLERGGHTIERVELLMDTETGDSVVAAQVFTAAPPASPPAEAAEVLVLSFNTANFDSTTGAVSFINRLHTLKVRVFVVGQPTAAASNSVQLTLTNADTAVVTVTFANTGASATDDAGQLWFTGDITATAVPVIFSTATPGPVGSVTFTPSGTCGTVPCDETLAVKTATSSPFTVTWAKTTSVAGGGSANFLQQTLTISVNAVIGGSATGALATSALFRVDNAPPQGGVLVLLTQGPPPLAGQLATNPCCSGNWAGSAYVFADGHTAAAGGVAPADTTNGTFGAPSGVAGVGIGTVTYHVGAASLSATAIAALPAVAVGSDVAASQTNTAYELVARVADKLDNFVVVPMSASPPFAPAVVSANPLLTLGVDLVAPTASFAAGSVASQAINPTAPWSYVISASDDASGFSAAPVPHRVIGNFVETTAAACVIGVFSGGICQRILGGVVISGPAAPTDQYYTFQGNVWDQGGNASADLARDVLFDVTPPTVSNVAIPSSLVGGAPATFTAAIADNVDLLSYVFSLDFASFSGTGTLPFGPPTVIGQFGLPLDQSATASATINFVRSIELTTAGNAPSGVLEPALAARFFVFDVALNTSTQFNTFAAGTVPAGTAATGFATFLVDEPSAATNVNNGTGDATAACPASTPTTRTVTAIAVGAVGAGSFANPFASVLFYRTDAGGRHHVFAVAATATQSIDIANTATWTWSVTFDATDLAVQAGVPIFAVGVSAAGDGLVTQNNTNLTICD